MRHRFDSEHGVFLHELSSPIGLTEFKAIQRDCYRAATHAYRRVLWRLGPHSLLWSYVDILAPDPAFMEWLAERRPEGRTAFVTALETNRVLLRQLRDAQPWSTEWAFFEDDADAMTWLQALRQ